MAKKKKTTPTFNAGSFRLGEEVTMGNQLPEYALTMPEVYAAVQRSKEASARAGVSIAAAKEKIAQSKTKLAEIGARMPKPGTAGAAQQTTVPQTGGGFDMAGFLAQQEANAALAAQQAAAAAQEAKRAAGQSAYDLLFEQFQQYGLGALVEPLKGFIIDGLSPAEFTLRLRDTDAYRKRFAANQQRIAKGLRALSEAEYIGLEDQYQNIMRNYGLPPAYYARGEMGRQEGFEKFIAGDVSATELEDRIQTAQNRVINAAPQVADTLRQFYPDITNGDILAYALDPDQALTNIRRKVTAAEIGAGAAMAGLTTGVARAEELGRSQTTAEQEVFGLAGAVEAQRQRRKLTELETAAFSGTSGAAAGALARDRAGSI